MKINGKPDGGGGGGVIIDLTATENGIYIATGGVDGYSPVEVDVQPTLESLSVSENGTYTPGVGVDGYSQVEVSVIPPLQSKAVTVNGDVTPDEGYYGLSVVTVSVPQSVTGYTEKEVTEKVFNIVNLNNSASYVASYAFISNPIQTINMPNCIRVYDNAFKGCTSLSQISLPECYYVNGNAFQGCNIETLDLPKCSTIGNYAFQSCKMTSLTNLQKCIDIATMAFNNCNKLQIIDLPLCQHIGGSAFKGCTSLSQASLPYITSIQAGGFMDTSIISLTLPCCYFIEGTTFNNCKSLTYIDLPVISTTYNGVIFNNCSSLSTIYLCSETYTIPNYFLNTTNIGVVTSIYTHVDNVSRFAVANGWSSISSLFIGIGDPDKPMLSYSDGVVTGYTNIVNRDFSTYLGINKQSITSINLTSCRIINSEALYNCTALQNISLPVCVTLELSAFGQCTSLQSIDLPVCKFIGNDAFVRCYSLSIITLRNDNVCVLRTYNAFRDTKIAQGLGSIYVPASLVDAYKADSVWSNFASQIFPIE